MKKCAILLTLLCLLFPLSLSAKSRQFEAAYSVDNSLPGPSLANATLNIELHVDGSNIKLIKVKTDNKGFFSIDSPYKKHLIVHILSIAGEGESMRCSGVSNIGQSKILISCIKI